MNRLFGTSKPQPPPVVKAPEVPKEAPKIIDLGEQAKRTEAKVQELSHSITQLDQEISDNYAKSKKMRGVQATTAKQRCIMLLKKKKMHEQQLSSLLNNQLTLDQMAFTQENITNTIEMVQNYNHLIYQTGAMSQAMVQQKAMFKDIDMDKMEDMMDDMEDMKAESEYMNEMMNRNYAVDIDEDDLDREMQEIENDMYMDSLQNQNQQKVQPYQQQGNQQQQKGQLQSQQQN